MRVLVLLWLCLLPALAQEGILQEVDRLQERGELTEAFTLLRDASREEAVRANPALFTRYSLRWWEIAELLCHPIADWPLTTALGELKEPRLLAEVECAMARHNLAVGEPEKAAKWFRQALARLQPGDPFLATLRAYEADFWMLVGEPQRAEELLLSLPRNALVESQLARVRGDRPSLAALQRQLPGLRGTAALACQTEIGRQLWSQGHKQEGCAALEAAVAGWAAIRAEHKLYAFQYMAYGDSLRALAETGHEGASRLLAEFEYPLLNRLLSYSSEEGRLELVSRIGLVELLVPFAGTPAGMQELARAVVRSKGLAIDTLLADIQKGILPEGKPLLERVHAARSRLEEPGGNRGERLRDLALAQMELARYNNLGWGRQVVTMSPEELAATLDSSSTLAEFIRYGDRYGVLLMTKASNRWFDLGPAAALEAQVRAYQRAVRGTGELQPALQAGYQAWVAPWIEAAPGRTLIISPDGELDFVSWATLVGPEGRFLAEDHDVRLVGTGRDLVGRLPGRYSTKALLLGDPDFQRKPPPGKAGVRGVSDQELRYLGFRPLPGARQEVQELLRGLPSKWTGEVVMGAQATEAELRRRFAFAPGEHPAIVHLATHGFFLPELARGTDPGQRLSRPMQRSGMALAGAGATVAAWKEGRIPPETQDGVLTAEEVAGLNLKGVWLVVMSACDTGLGEARAGEGVLGLRRAFLLAGASQLLFTLWPVNDQVTRELMRDFYARALTRQEPPWRSLAAIQRDWLMKLRREKGLSAAARLAGAFVLTSTGRL